MIKVLCTSDTILKVVQKSWIFDLRFLKIKHITIMLNLTQSRETVISTIFGNHYQFEPHFNYYPFLTTFFATFQTFS